MSNPIHSLTHNTPIAPVSNDQGKEEAVPVNEEAAAPIDLLPDDVMYLIFRYATNDCRNGKTLSAIRAVNGKWYGLIDSYNLRVSWSQLQHIVKNPSLRTCVDQIVLIDRFVTQIIASAIAPQYTELDTLEQADLFNRIEFMSPSSFSRFADLTQRIRGQALAIPDPSVIGFEAASYEITQHDLDSSLEAIWAHLRQDRQIFQAIHLPNKAQSIRQWFNNPANAAQIANRTELHLDILNLPQMNLRLLPSEIGHFSQLDGLNLQSNQLSSLPLTLNNFSRLEFLFLAHNRFSSFPPVICNLLQLTSLCLSYNELSSLPEAIGNLTQLQNLNLNKNKLSDFPPTFANLIHLETLSIFGNQFLSLPPFIGNLTSLQILNLNSNQLSSLPSTIGNLTSLQMLNLSSNQLSSLPSTIANLTQLQKLDLESNLLSSFPPIRRHISQFTILTNPLLCMLRKDFLPPEVRSPSVKELLTKSSTCLNYACHTPLASLCQEILRGSQDDALQNAFEKLSDEWQQRIRQHWSAIPSSSSSSSDAKEENLFADRGNFAKAVIASMQKQWEELSTKEVNLTYSLVAILAGHLMENLNECVEAFGLPPLSGQEFGEALQKLQTMWGQDHAEENIIRLIDAMELVTQQ